MCCWRLQPSFEPCFTWRGFHHCCNSCRSTAVDMQALLEVHKPWSSWNGNISALLVTDLTHHSFLAHVTPWSSLTMCSSPCVCTHCLVLVLDYFCSSTCICTHRMALILTEFDGCDLMEAASKHGAGASLRGPRGKSWSCRSRWTSCRGRWPQLRRLCRSTSRCGRGRRTASRRLRAPA